MGRSLGRAATAAVFLVLCSTSQAADRRWTLAPIPAWVETVPVPAEATSPTQELSSGIHYLLSDHQTNVATGSTAQYHHWAWKVLSTSGLEQASELKMRFDPSFERLLIHHVTLTRQGTSVGTWSARDVKIIQDEDQLDQRIYDESLTALVFVKDVRPGDVLDYAYTVQGQNPLLQGRFVDTLQMSYSVPVSVIRHRILWPKSRTLHHKGHPAPIEPETKPSGDQVEYVWEQHDVPPLGEEDRAPGWYDASRWVQLTEFNSWAEVATWAAKLFQSANKPSVALDQLASPWKNLPTEEERARTAVRLVQDDIRYLGIEIGPNSHLPHAPAQTFEQRFGDCKDKALLLAVLLNKLGFEAKPVLVNTEIGHALDEWLPTPFAFDHAIVQARVDGKLLWIDGTRSQQGGLITETVNPPFERALVVRDGETGLTPIALPEAAEPTTVVEETYTAPASGKAGQLRVLTTYTREDADDIRSAIESESPSERASGYLNFYARRHSRIRALVPPAVHDSRETNVITVAERYELPDFWSKGERWMRAWPVVDRVTKPSTTLRGSPLQVEHPVRLRYRVKLEGPGVELDPPEPDVITDSAFSYSRSAQTEDGGLIMTYDYASKADHVAVADVPAYLGHIDDLYDSAGYEIEHSGGAIGARPSRLPQGPRSSPWAGALVFGLLLIALTWLAASSLHSRRRRAAFAGPSRYGAGVSPETALRVETEMELRARMDSLSCACGGRMWGEAEWTACRYEERKMSIVARRCGRCGETQSIYADVAQANSAGV
ncbi:MAG: DUF3857 domain-containing protein [Vicinamibacteria bacterium]